MDRELIEEMEKELEALWAQADDRTKARILAWEIFKEKEYGVYSQRKFWER